ncbi:MAG: site-specific integrase [Actinobacteria bacterium]|nr:site-specific integrase [Actinomycetota bacterium]
MRSSDVPTVGAYLRDWMEIQRHRLQPTSWKSYLGCVERYLIPNLGDIPLGELSAVQLEKLWARLLESGGQDGASLSPRTVQYAAQTLHKALNDAVRTELLGRNVASLAETPNLAVDGEDTTELQVWTAEQVRAFLDAIYDDPHRDIWELALGTGMRRGEQLGLRWQDVDLEDGLLYIRRSLQVVDGSARLKSTKTSRSRRIRIDDRLVDVLGWRRQVQDRQRRRAGDRWVDEWGLVFTDTDGSWLNPMNISAAFRRLVRRLDVPNIRLHDLRHTHATLLLEAGVPIKVVSERLGHASVQATLEVYAHVLPAMEADAVVRFSEHVHGVSR